MSSLFTHVPEAAELSDCELQLLFSWLSSCIPSLKNAWLTKPWKEADLIASKTSLGSASCAPSRQISQATPLIPPYPSPPLLCFKIRMLSSPWNERPLSTVGVEPVWEAILHSQPRWYCAFWVMFSPAQNTDCSLLHGAVVSYRQLSPSWVSMLIFMREGSRNPYSLLQVSYFSLEFGCEPASLCF